MHIDMVRMDIDMDIDTNIKAVIACGYRLVDVYMCL